MAFYSSSYSTSNFGEYNCNSYALNYDSVQNPEFIAYDYQQFNQSYYGYDPSLYYDPAPTLSYSAATFSEPKLIEYNPNYEKSQLVIYYSNLEFNEPEFEEYDPTPYDGGYDIVQTYGKPLPPSDQTCYPRSGSSDSKALLPSGPIVPLPLPMPNVEKGTDEKAIVPQNQSAGKVTDEMPQPQRSLTDLNSSDGDDTKEHETDDGDGDGDSGSGYGNGYSGGDYDGYVKAVTVQYPYGYGLEALDLCESVFGYWPCLARMKEREKCCEGDCCCREKSENMWKGTADYLFGSPNPYGRREEEGNSYGGGDLVYAYQRHYPTQAEYKQVQNYYANSSWF